jgi:hypothetical protein
MGNNEYFLINYPLSINIEKLKENENIPNAIEFESKIPAPFRMASDITAIDSQALQPLKLNNDTTQVLWNFLLAQNQKINTLLSYVLSQQDNEKFRYQSTAFSAGCCIFECNDNTFSVGQNILLKIFIPEESAAVFCYATVTAIKEKQVELTYQQIREEDRELLIRATLHIQSKQLKLRAAQRAQTI